MEFWGSVVAYQDAGLVLDTSSVNVDNVTIYLKESAYPMSRHRFIALDVGSKLTRLTG